VGGVSSVAGLGAFYRSERGERAVYWAEVISGATAGGG
jgi:hypothetical protein